MASLKVINASSNITVPDNVEVHTNTSSASFTVTLPEAPSNNALVRVLDIGRNWGTNALTVAASGRDTILEAGSLVLSVPGCTYDFVYIASITQWVYFYEHKLDPNIVNNVTSNSYLTTTLSDNTLDLTVSSGSITENVSSVLVLQNLNNAALSSGTIEVKQATTSQAGYLASSDWNTFNDKLNPISSPTNNDFVFVNSSGQVVDSGLSFSTTSTTNNNTTLLSSAAVHTAIENNISGVLKLQGTWNASTNTPTLTAGTGTLGYAYYVSVAGTQTTPSGNTTTYNVGDLIFYSNINVWDSIDNTENVVSVFGRSGLVTAQSGDYTISQVTNGLSNQLNSTNVYVGNSSNVATGVALSGDATLSNTGALTVSANAITNSKLAQASSNTWMGNNSGSTSNVSNNLTRSLTEDTSSVLTITGGANALLNATTIEVKQASTVQSGYLSSSDWNTFNNKQGGLTSGTGIITITSNVLNLATQAANTILSGPVSGASSVPTFRALSTDDIFPSILTGSFVNGVAAIYNGTKFSPSTGLTWLSNTLTAAGRVVANSFGVKESAGYQGTATLGTNGRVVVTTAAISSTTRIYLTTQSNSGTAGFLYVSNRNNGNSFTIQSSQNGDRSTVAWLLVAGL